LSSNSLPLANGAFLSSHAEFCLCRTPAFLATASLSKTGFVPEFAAFTGLKSNAKGFEVGGLEAGFSPPTHSFIDTINFVKHIICSKQMCIFFNAFVAQNIIFGLCFTLSAYVIHTH
jgi:hypothetical protein